VEGGADGSKDYFKVAYLIILASAGFHLLI